MKRSLFYILSALAFVSIGSGAKAQVAVIGNTIEEYTSAPGESYSGSILVENSSDEVHRVHVYQTDYAFQSDGRSNFDNPGTLPRSNARWITPIARVIVVGARSRTSVAYTVNVPRDSALSGTYWSTIMVEGSPSPPARGSTAGSDTELSIGAVTRYAVQVATHIASTGSRKVALRSPSVVIDQAGNQGFEVEILNTGERAYRAKVWIELYDAAGTITRRLEQQRGLLYPGSSLKQRFDLGKLVAGSYRALVFADTGDPTVFAKQFSIKL